MEEVKKERLNNILTMCKLLLFTLILVAGVYFMINTKFAFGAVDAGIWKDKMAPLLEIYNNIIMPTIVAGATILLSVAGVSNFLKMKNAGDEGEREKAKKAILFWLISVIGVIVALWAVPNIIGLAQGWLKPPTVAI